MGIINDKVLFVESVYLSTIRMDNDNRQMIGTDINVPSSSVCQYI